MGRIDGKSLSEIFTPQSGSGNSITNGGVFFGSPARYLQENQGLNPQFGADDKNKLSGNTGAKETFWVGKSADAKKVGEKLLRENFGFEEIDVRAYKTLYDDFKIFDEKQCAASGNAGKSCEAATPEQIRKWQTSADGKKVAVSLPEATVKFLRDFRQTRLIERRVMDISDSQIRAQTEKDLTAAVTKSEQARADAFLNLRNALEDDSPDGKKAAALIKLIANLPENKENPFTQILLAKIELKEIYSGENVKFNPNDLTKIEQRVSRAVDSAAGYSDATKQRDPKKAVSRSEAQTLNEEAARLADRFGKPSEARFRTLLARFYAVDDAERVKYDAMKSPEWTTLPRLKENSAASLSPVSSESTALEQFRRENPPPDVIKELAEDPQKREWKTTERTDGKGGIKTEAYQQFQQEGSMKPTGVEEINGKVFLDEKGAGVKKGSRYYRSMPVTSRQTVEAKEINPGGTTRAFGTAGAVTAMEDINKWTPFLADLYYGTTAKKVETFLKLKKADFDANNFPVPPKPERIQRMKRDLVTYRYTTQADFQRVQSVMKRLEDLSYAFWNR